MWKWMGLLLRKNYLLKCWCWPSLRNWIRDLKLSLLLKLPPRKLEPWFILWSFFFLKLLCISINLPCIECHAMKYCCCAWANAPSCYLELLDKLQKWICRTVGPSLAAFLEPLANRRTVASLSLFYRYYFGRCSPERAQLVPLPFSGVRSTRWLHDFSVTIPKRYSDVYVNSFFPRTARLWNSLPIECVPLTYDLNGFKLGSF